MPDFGAPVASSVNVNPQQGIQTLSGLMSLKQKQQALQMGAAQVQEEQQTASQRAGLAQFYKNWDISKHVGPDGTLDLDSVLTDPQLRQAAGDQFPQVVQQMIQAKSGQLQTKQQLANLNDSVRTQFQDMLGGLRTDGDVVDDNPAGRQKVQRAIGQFAATSPDAARIAQIYGTTIDKTPQGKLVGAISNFQLQAMDAGTQSGRQAPSYTNSGDKLVQTNPQAAGGAPQGDITVGLAPTDQPDYRATLAARTGAAAGVTERVQQVQAAANNTVQAQDALTRARTILETSGTNTGAAFEKMKALKNLFASAGMDTEGATDANSLVKNLARYEAARATQAGLGGTDAARELAHAGSPNTQVDKKALLGIINQSLATEKALAAYAAKQSKTQDPNQLIRNENDFRSIPNLIEGYEYGMTRNKDEANLFLGKHGVTPQQMKETRRRIKEFEGS